MRSNLGRTKIFYEGGAVEEVNIRPKHMLVVEDAGIDITLHPVRATFLAAHAALGTSLAFDRWMDAVESIEMLGEADPPNGSATSTGGSPESQPQPV